MSQPENRTIRIDLNIEEEVASLNLPDDALLTPTAVWFAGSGTADIVVEFEVGVEGQG